MGFPSGSVVKIHLCCRRCWRLGFNPWFGKIPWRRKWQPTPVFLPGKTHGPWWGRKESDMTGHTWPLPFLSSVTLGKLLNHLGFNFSISEMGKGLENYALWQPGWEGSLGSMNTWVPLLFTWSHHKIVNWLYPNTRRGNGTPLQYSCLENPMDGGA